MSATTTSTAIWTMHAERWRKSIKAKSLSVLTERSYLSTAQRTRKRAPNSEGSPE